ncbi:MAG: hypothetical protein WC058_09075 [Phycisphaeraceae bacterium]
MAHPLTHHSQHTTTRRNRQFWPRLDHFLNVVLHRIFKNMLFSPEKRNVLPSAPDH